MSVQQDIWTQFKTQVSGNATLAAYVSTFKFNNQPAILDNSAYPMVHCFVTKIENEIHQAIPKRKFIDMRISCAGKIKNETPDNVLGEVLKLDEYIKNAIESNLTLSGKATFINIGDSEIRYLDDKFAESVFEVIIKSPLFTAGSR